MPAATLSVGSEAVTGGRGYALDWGRDVRWLIAGLIVLVALLQYRLWTGSGSLAEVHVLRDEITRQESELERLRARNKALAAEVDDLKTGLDAIEEHARSELGMIKSDEVFLQVINPDNEGGAR